MMAVAVVKKWYKDKYHPYSDIQDLDNHPELNNPPNTLRLKAWSPDRNVPESIYHHDKVMLLGTSFPKAIMKHLAKEGKLTWIDNHEAAMLENWEAITIARSLGNKSQLRLNKKFTTSELTWSHLMVFKIPEAVELVREYEDMTDEEQVSVGPVRKYWDCYNILEKELSDNVKRYKESLENKE